MSRPAAGGPEPDPSGEPSHVQLFQVGPAASGWALALHGGAGARRGRDYGREIPHMRGLIEAARDRLTAGASALDVAVETVTALEASGMYVAGRGAAPNTAGKYELDASLMDGSTRKAGFA